MMRPTVSIVIPAHNEEKRIRTSLESYCQYFKKSGEIVVVLNGCTDRTEEVVQQIKKQYPEHFVRVVVVQKAGKALAVRRGFETATGLMIGFVDADGATSPVEFAKLIAACNKADGAIASRWSRGSQILNRTSTTRKIASVGFRWITKALFRLPYHDTQCGAKVFREKVVHSILPHLRITSMAFDVELLILARSNGYQIVEIPTIWVDHRTVMSSPLRLLRASINVFVSLVALRARATREHLV